MSTGSNKEVLLNVLVHEWSTNQAYAQKIGNRVLYVTHGNRCTKGNSFEGRMTATDVVDLHSTQEEADRRMFLHAFHASADGHHNIATFSSDTDVEVLASHHQAAVPVEIILIRDTMSRSHFVSIRRLCEKLGHRVCQVPSSLHALTGCGTVRSFVGSGKKKALDCHIARETVQILGQTIPPGEHDINKLKKVICKLYNEHQCDRVDELRYRMFCKGKNVQSHQLPPTRASLENHLKRADYQAYIWKCALEP